MIVKRAAELNRQPVSEYMTAGHVTPTLLFESNKWMTANAS